MILQQFQTVGRDLFDSGLIYSQSGNLSLRLGDRLIITRRGSRLGSLQEHDLIETGIEKNDRSTPLASIELPVHRAIYQHTPALAIVHAHPRHAVTLSLAEEEFVPPDTEGQVTLGQIPVLGWGSEVTPGGLADVIAGALKERKIVLVRGHGSFAIGQLLEEAYSYTTVLEASCQISCLLRTIRTKPPTE
ncbi:MAG: aldolase [Chloroflexi bacterium]|nr:aldolase [Chloroflexota bacterium]